METMAGKSIRNAFYEQGIALIKHSLRKLADHYDMLILEGAGSPVEVNLKERELVNMKIAQLADVPVILVADIERGGVFASIIGTLFLLTADERGVFKGLLLINFVVTSRRLPQGSIGLKRNRHPCTWCSSVRSQSGNFNDKLSQ